MNIFDPHISGSLSVSGSAEISGDLTVLGVVTATISGTTTNALTASFAPNYTLTSSFGDFTSSINTTIKNKLNTDGVVSGSSQIVISDTTGFAAFSSSISSSVTTIIVDNFGQDNRLNAIETSTGSLNSFTSSINTTIKNKLNTEGVISGSIQVNLTDTTGYSTFSSSVSSSVGVLSSSVAVTDLNQNNRLNSLEGKSGSYATTGSNTFVGSQVISGSVTITQNLTVFGSSSIVYVTSSQLRVDDNIITLNTSTPGQRFGGIEVYDSGSVTQATGSILWDSVNNRWIYQQSSEAGYGGGMFLSGPRSSGSLGDELSLTSGKIARSAGGDHLNDSIITEYGATTIGINGGLIVTGSILSTVTPLVSGSSQISYTGLANVPSGIVSGSSQITYSSISSIPGGIVSGSSQITYSSISSIPSGIVSGSSQISYPSLSNIPGGIVSGSSQIDLTATTNYSSGIKTRLNAEGVISGSSQITLTSTQVTNGLGYTPYNSTNPNGYITGISFANVSSKPTTLSGYGITDSLYQASYSGLNVNAFNGTGLYRGSTDNWTNKPTVVHNGGALLQIDTHPGNYHQQLFFDSGGNRLYMRSADAGTWGSWVTMIHSGTIGSQSVNYATTAGSAPNATNVNTNYDVTAGNGNGLRFWNGSDSYKISMGNSSLYTYGTVSDYSIKMQMNDADTGRGFTWGRISYAPIASLNSTSGNMQIAGTMSASNFSGSSSGTNTGDQTNISGTANNITAYTINQNLGTGNSPTFAGLTSNNPVNIMGSSLYVTASQLHIGKTSSGTAQMSFESWGSYTGAIAMNSSGQFHMGGQGNVSFYWKKNCTYNGDYSASGTSLMSLDTNGNLIVTGTLTETSSLRYKKDILTIEGGLDMVLRMRGVTYLKKENNIKEVGVIAEEIGEILPDLVKYNTEGQIDSVSYGRITAVLIEAIKELKQEINDLKNNG